MGMNCPEAIHVVSLRFANTSWFCHEIVYYPSISLFNELTLCFIEKHLSPDQRGGRDELPSLTEIGETQNHDARQHQLIKLVCVPTYTQVKLRMI